MFLVGILLRKAIIKLLLVFLKAIYVRQFIWGEYFPKSNENVQR